MNVRPEEGEYGGHFGNYIRQVPEGDLIELLAAQGKETASLIASLDETRGGYRYAEGKWTLKQVIGHIADTERVMAYRLLRFARGDETSLPGFDQDTFNAHAPFDGWTFAQLAEDYRSVRAATLSLLRGLPEEAWSRKGTASQVGMTARALGYVIAGHELHHLAIIRSRYLG